MAADPLCLKRACDFRAMPDAELPEDVRKVSFDRAIGEEERRGDLLVRLALGDEGPRRAPRLVSAPPVTLRAPLIRSSSRPCPLGPERRADAHRRSERPLEGFARLAPSLRAPLRRAARQQSPPAIEGKSYLRMQL